MIALFQPLQLFIFKRHTKTIFLNNLLFSVAYFFIMFCKVLAAVLKHPVYFLIFPVNTEIVNMFVNL
jgi:hypothetical protein